MRQLSFDIPGDPQQQGSKAAWGADANKNLKPWRAVAITIIRQAMGPDWQPFTGPCQVSADFIFARPKSHYGTGRNANVLKDSAPKFKTSAPDKDKCMRALGDVLTQAGAWRDDSLWVRSVEINKVYGDRPGVLAIVTEVDQ